MPIRDSNYEIEIVDYEKALNDKYRLIVKFKHKKTGHVVKERTLRVDREVLDDDEKLKRHFGKILKNFENKENKEDAKPQNLKREIRGIKLGEYSDED